jgi:O-antigen/teichoic acid export membrane protein
MSNLHGRMAKGVMWSLLEKGGQQGISFLVFMVIARLVGPTEYGLANVCFVIFTIVNLLILAIVDGIVNLQIEDDERLSTLFWGVMGLGLGLSLLCVGGSVPLAMAMDEPRLRDLILWFAVIPLLLALASVPSMILMKELDFRVYALRSLTASTIGGAVGIAAAFNGYGAYSLIFQQITLFGVANLVVWVSVKWRPRASFSRDLLAITIKPGLKMVGSTFITVVEREVPRVMIMFLMGPFALGYYSFVARVRYAVQDIIVNPPFAVLYASLAKLKQDRPGQVAILDVFVMLTGSLIFPALTAASVAAPLYMTLFFGSKWDGVIPLLQVFILCGAVLPLQAIVREMLRSHDHLQSFLRLQAVYVATVLIATAVVLPYGLVPIAVATLVVGVAFLPIYFAALQKWEGVSLWPALIHLWAPMVSSALMAAAIMGYADSPYAAANPWARLVIALCLGGIVYCLAAALLMRRDIRRVVTFIKTRRAARIQSS